MAAGNLLRLAMFLAAVTPAIVAFTAFINIVIVWSGQINKPLWNSRTVHLQEYHKLAPTAPESFFGVYWSARVELLSDSSYALYPVSHSTCYDKTASAPPTKPDVLGKYKTMLTLCSPNIWHEQDTCTTSNNDVESLLTTYAQVTDLTFDNKDKANWKLPIDENTMASNVNLCMFSKIKSIVAFDVDSHSLSVLAAGNLHVYVFTLLALTLIAYFNLAMRMTMGYDNSSLPTNMMLLLVYLYLFVMWNFSSNFSSNDEFDVEKITIDNTPQTYYTTGDKCFGGILFAWIMLNLFYMLTYHKQEDKDKDHEIWKRVTTKIALDDEETQPNMQFGGYVSIYPEVNSENYGLLQLNKSRYEFMLNKDSVLLFAVEQYRCSNVFLVAIPLYVMAVMSTTKHTLDISLQTALIGALMFGVVQYLFMNFTWAVTLIMPKKDTTLEDSQSLRWLVTIGHAFVLALACAIQGAIIYTLSTVLPTPLNTVRNELLILLGVLVGMNVLQSIFCWFRETLGLLPCLKLTMFILAVFVFRLGFGIDSNYSEGSLAQQILPDVGENTAADLVKRFWLYGLHVKLPDVEKLSYTQWDN
jgi:hypothetical protein